MKLITLLPPEYDTNNTMFKLQEIISKDITDLDGKFDKAIDECFIATASSLLSRYEKMYGLKVDINKSDEFRRERIQAKIRGIGTVTKQMISDTASSYSNGKVEVSEDPLNNSFKIKFVGTKGIPPNMADLKLTIDEIKPAHLTYTFEYVYNTHTQVASFMHTQLSAYTHHQMREGVT